VTTTNIFVLWLHTNKYFVTSHITFQLPVQFCNFPQYVYKVTKTTDFFVTYFKSVFFRSGGVRPNIFSLWMKITAVSSTMNELARFPNEKERHQLLLKWGFPLQETGQRGKDHDQCHAYHAAYKVVPWCSHDHEEHLANWCCCSTGSGSIQSKYSRVFKHCE